MTTFRFDRLIELRRQRRYTQVKLAQLLGVGRTTVTMLELGKTDPSLETLVSIARTFGVSTDYLLGLTDDPDLKAVNYGERFDPLPFS